MGKVLDDIERCNRIKMIIGKSAFSRGPGRMVSPKDISCIIQFAFENVYTCSLPPLFFISTKKKPKPVPTSRRPSFSSVCLSRLAARWKTGLIISPMDSIEGPLQEILLIERRRESMVGLGLRKMN